jgi:hypothetical protein
MSIETINELLDKAGNTLDHAAQHMVLSELQPSGEYIYRVGEALAKIFEIQRAIYAIRPELTPSFLREPSSLPAGESRRFGDVFLASLELENKGAVREAEAKWERYLESKPHDFFAEKAKEHLARLRERP